MTWRDRVEGVLWGILIAQVVLWVGAGVIWLIMNALAWLPKLHSVFYATLGEWAVMGWLSVLCIFVGLAISPAISKDVAEAKLEKLKALDKLVTGGR